MAYVRRRTRFRRRKTIRRMVADAKNQRFKRRVLAIAKQPVETKSFPDFTDIPTIVLATGYAVGPQWAIRQNIFAGIPRADSAATKSEHEVIGNQMEARGFWIRVNVLSHRGINSDLFGLDLRLTVYSMADWTGTTGGVQNVVASDEIFDPDYAVNSYFTAYPFNMQRINVLKSKKFSMNFNGNNGNVSREFRMWVPLRGRKTARDEESTLVNSNFGELKGRNYWWLLEFYMPGVPEQLNSRFTDRIFGNIQTRVYFKDA